jgi:peptidoglycan/LPS O-acetylase OafA/YrhL
MSRDNPDSRKIVLAVVHFSDHHGVDLPERRVKKIMPPTNRLYYLDNLRVALTILVIAHHVGQAYGPTGGTWPVQEVTRAAVLGPFFTVNRSFFMSLFFMISGYLMVGAYDRHGCGAFIRSRLVRLGIPVLAFAVLLFLMRALSGHIGRWNDMFTVGHLWYLEHVLIFSVVYALWRRLRSLALKSESSASKEPGNPPVLVVILPFVLLVAVMSAIIRIWSPIDHWMNLLGFISVAFADVPRDLSFFVFGALAFRHEWFENYPVRNGMAWLAVGVAAAAAWYAWSLFGRAALPLSPVGHAIVYPIWESILCFGMCIGLLVLFRELVNFQGPVEKFLAANQYSAYVWHPILIVAIQAAILKFPLDPFLKFAIVTAVGVPVVFLWSWAFRNLRPVRAVM